MTKEYKVAFYSKIDGQCEFTVGGNSEEQVKSFLDFIINNEKDIYKDFTMEEITRN